jgi:tetratricopeptide (TPR) repeat protein
MRAFVFTDRALEGQAGRFVWLSVDTEKERNAGFLADYPIEAYPTLLVIDPQREQAVVRWIGGAGVRQLTRILDEGERLVRGEVHGADAVLADADRLMGRGKKAAAARAYRRALDEAPADWPGRERAVEALLLALDMAGKPAECIETARARLPVERTQHFANVALLGLGCGLGMEGPEGKAAVAEFEPAVRSAATDPGIELPADDRSSLYTYLLEARRAAEDEAGVKALAAQWLAFLEAEAERAPTAQARTVFDSHRVSAALALGEPARAIGALEQSERDFPEDYNPPARLALLLGAAGRHDEALAAADRALERVYGPRKLRIYTTRADILEQRGDREAAQQTLRDALAYARSLPASQVPRASVAAIEQRLARERG